ncbi:MAG: beta-propeller domain-containing protein [Dehalococcoidia bacterium]|nr:beta-propeller domain-containing protein [Dehalococcoidia bacterium]
MRTSRIGTVFGLVVILAMIAAITIGCFAAAPSRTAEQPAEEPGTSVEWKPEASLEGGLKRFSSYQELKDFLKTAPWYPGWMYWSDARLGVVAEGSFGYPNSAKQAPDFSRTNIQVEGVDEADIVKSDGQYIYLATDNRLVIARAYPADQARVLCKLELEGNIWGLFINQDRLAVIEGNEPWYGIYREFVPYPNYQVKTSVKIYDVSDRKAPVLEREVSVDGYYVASRMIGDYVYLVVSGSVWTDNDNVTLPRIYGENGVGEVQPGDIWHSDTPDYGYGFTTIVSVNVADDDEEPVHETLLLGSASTIYVSTSNIYVTFPQWSTEMGMTAIHRIHIDDGQIEYHATGAVPGWLLNQFSLDEHGEYLRVATTVGNAWGGSWGTGSTNNVYVLDQKLDIFGRLENLAPGEDVYSARFMGTRCYLVTFRKIDPLFVIDLANPGMPQVLGELKITGYSDYLHPYDENHVIGIGKETIAAEEGDFAWYQGVKISLFDVSDVANPREIAKYEIGDRGTDSPVLHDHKAFLFDKSKNLLVLPVSVAEIDERDYQGSVPSWAYGEIVWQGAYVFDISLENGLELRGRITHCEGGAFQKRLYDPYYGYPSCAIERSLYIGNVLYTISDQQIGMNDLVTLEDLGKISLN